MHLSSPQVHLEKKSTLAEGKENLMIYQLVASRIEGHKVLTLYLGVGDILTFAAQREMTLLQ